jgi:hypothetical protein
MSRNRGKTHGHEKDRMVMEQNPETPHASVETDSASSDVQETSEPTGSPEISVAAVLVTEPSCDPFSTPEAMADNLEPLPPPGAHQMDSMGLADLAMAAAESAGRMAEQSVAETSRASEEDTEEQHGQQAGLD